eukprot:scaffold36964_cov71-Attheya_sp.AAC.1
MYQVYVCLPHPEQGSKTDGWIPLEGRSPPRLESEGHDTPGESGTRTERERKGRTPSCWEQETADRPSLP